MFVYDLFDLKLRCLSLIGKFNLDSNTRSSSTYDAMRDYLGRPAWNL